MLVEPETVPILDFSLLISRDPDQRSKIITQLGNECLEWGFFMVINHGVPETLRDEMIRETESFFDLRGEEKRQYAGKKLFDPVRCGTSFNPNVDQTLLWRDYHMIHVDPHFNAPSKPYGFRYCMLNYFFLVNAGDHMLNGFKGLQVMHNGKWVPINPLHNSFLVNTGDHMEILTNGKYKSVVHQVVVNYETARIFIGTAHGPPLDTIISPSPELVADGVGQAYLGIKYRNY